MKKITVFFVLIMAMLIFCGITAFASPCCNVNVQTVTEDENETVFKLKYDTITVPRDIKVDCKYKSWCD